MHAPAEAISATAYHNLRCAEIYTATMDFVVFGVRRVPHPLCISMGGDLDSKRSVYVDFGGQKNPHPCEDRKDGAPAGHTLLLNANSFRLRGNWNSARSAVQ